MKRKRRLEAPRYVGNLPNLGGVANFPPQIPTAAGVKSELEEAAQLGLFRSIAFSVDPTIGYSELVIGVRSAAYLKVTDILGLTATDIFSARLSARPLGTLGANAGQSATALGALASQRSRLSIPFGGEWLIRLSLVGPVGTVTVLGQIFELANADLVTALSTGGPSDYLAQRVAVTAAGPTVRLNDCLNVALAQIQYESSIAAGGQPTFVDIGSPVVSLQIPRLNFATGADALLITPVMQSLTVRYAGGGGLNNSVVNCYLTLE